jgi:uncharacterized protein with PIN domain
MWATFTFIDELNDFLPHYRRGTSFSLEFAPHQNLKHMLESMGVPHTEFGHLLVDSKPADPDILLWEGAQVTVYPADYLLEGEARFILDNHLGQLATYLRMLGFDSLYRNDYQDEELAREGVEQGRVLLTRDRRLLMRKVIRLGYCIHQTDPKKQVAEVLKRFRLFERIKPFQRCLKCNTPLQAVPKQKIIDRLEPLTKKYYNEFRICPACNQIYWKGSHFERMLQMIDEMHSQP